MGGEPWCFPADVVARMTDYQIDEAYLAPAVARAEALERERKGLPPKPDPAAPVPDTPPPRAAVVGVMVHHLGYTVEKANAEYDRQLAEWKAQQKG